MTKKKRRIKADTWFDKIRYKYWDIVPYDWRPGQIWYRFKCWAWKRYTTVKPRYLPHTWCDRCSVLPHVMFEVLSEFLEKECSPGHVEWYGECGHKVTVNGEEKYVRDEMQELYDWWHKIYNKQYEEVEKAIWKMIEDNNCGPQGDWDDMNDPLVDEDGEVYAYQWNPKYKSPEKQAMYYMLINALHELERQQHEDLEEKMIRLCRVRGFMWT